MAIYNGRILMRKGNEADFDASKLMSGEWAVSLDAGIVRICLEAGKVIRMATYEAFEEDMKQIEAILLECQTIEEAVQRINTEINAKVDAVVEYVGQAKTYRDEAKTFRDEAEAFKNQAGEIAGIDIATTEKAGIVKPDGETLEVNADGTMRVIGGGGVSDYTELENKPSINGTELNGDKTLNDLGIASATELEKTNTKVDTIIEKANLGIKETASGEEIHLIDSAEGKAVEFALYGKATQDGEPTPENPQEIEVSGESYNLLPYPYHETTHEDNGIAWTDNNGIITANGTTTADSFYTVSINANVSANEEYILSGCPSGGSANTYALRVTDHITVAIDDIGNGIKFSYSDVSKFEVMIRIRAGYTANNLTFKPMIRKASVKNDRYMPYGKGSVEVKSCGSNILGNLKLNKLVTNTSGKVVVDSSNYWSTVVDVRKFDKVFISGDYSILNSNTLRIGLFTEYPKVDTVGTRLSISTNREVNVNEYNYMLLSFLRTDNGMTEENGKELMNSFMVNEGTTTLPFEPYKETTTTIPTPNGLAGIKVSANGNYTDQNGQQWICDEVVKYADGSGAYIQRIGRKTLTSVGGIVSSTNTYTNYTRFYSTSFNDRKKSGDSLGGICNMATFDILQKTDTKDGIGKCHFNPYSQYFNFYYIQLPKETLGISVSDDEDTQKAKANEWISSNPITVYYEIEPIHTPLTAEEIAEIEKLHTFYPVTNISNDFDCGMRVTYYCDSKNYINNQLAIIKQEQEEAMMNILSLMPTEVQAMMIENDTNDLLKESEI